MHIFLLVNTAYVRMKTDSDTCYLGGVLSNGRRFKLLVVDIDGTLIGYSKKVSDRDKEALLKVREKGTRVALATGRVLQSTRRVIEDLGIDGEHVYYDGALISTPCNTNPTYARFIEKDIIERAVAFARKTGAYLELYSTEHFFAERENWSDDIHKKLFGVDPVITSFDGIWEREHIIKAELISRSAEESSQVEAFKRKFDGELRFSVAHTPKCPGVDFVNIIDNEVSKGHAVQIIAEGMGITLDEVIAVGDGSNDVPLLTAAGFAVAMGNARKELKEIADHITSDVESSGVAEAIEKFLF